MTETFSQKALRLVTNYIFDNSNGANVDSSNIKVVWACKTLQNWKALVADLNKGGLFFEVTYNGDKKETYVDAYSKIDNIKVSDGS